MQLINDNKYNFITIPELRNFIIKAGRRKIVFVEGVDDKIIFDILYKNYLSQFMFINACLEGIKNTSDTTYNLVGWQAVKSLLKEFILNLKRENRFYGVVDRDLRTDEEIELERMNPDYDGKLFTFSERYTLENYFIEVKILADFLKGQSINHKKLISVTNNDENLEEFVRQAIGEIEPYLVNVGAGNLTIRHFAPSQSFLEHSISSDNIESRIKDRLSTVIGNGTTEEDIILKFNEFKSYIIDNNFVQKFASGKDYFSTQFNKLLKRKVDVDIQLNKHKQELARILKEVGFPHDFERLLSFLLAEATVSD